MKRKKDIVIPPEAEKMTITNTSRSIPNVRTCAELKFF